MLVNELIQNILIIAIIIIIFMTNYTFHIEKDCKKEFSLEETQCWKGLLSLFIVLDHLWMQHKLVSLALFHESAVIIVSIYFFFSGYGISVNSKRKENYMGLKFWHKRIVGLLIPMLIVDLMMFIWNWLCGSGTSKVMFWEYFTGKFLLNAQTWYIRELLICYLIFFILTKICSEPKKIVLGYAICITLMNIILFFCKYGYEWYGSNYGFLIGISLGYGGGVLIKKKQTLPFIMILVFLATGLLSIIYKLIGKANVLNILLTRNAMTFMATILFIIVTRVITVSPRKYDKVSQVSMEIFLVHMLVIDICMKLGLERMPVILVFTVLIAVLILSHLYHKFLGYMRKII